MTKTYKISLAKAGREVEIAFGDYTLEVQDYVIRYGLTQIVNDAASSVKSDDPDCAAKAGALADKKLDAMRAGEVRTYSVRTGDPIRREAQKMAREMVAKRPDHKGASTKRVNETAERYVAIFMERAAEKIAFEAEVMAAGIEMERTATEAVE